LTLLHKRKVRHDVKVKGDWEKRAGINFALLKDCFPAYGPPSGAQPARVGHAAVLSFISLCLGTA